MAEPTFIEIHNHNYGSGGGPLEEIRAGVEVSRTTATADVRGWLWGPIQVDGITPSVDFKEGKTYVIYEVD